MVALQVARELEDPFGHQIHQLDLAGLQSHFNDRLWVLTQRKYWRCAASTPLCRLDARLIVDCVLFVQRHMAGEKLTGVEWLCQVTNTVFAFTNRSQISAQRPGPTEHQRTNRGGTDWNLGVARAQTNSNELKNHMGES